MNKILRLTALLIAFIALTACDTSQAEKSAYKAARSARNSIRIGIVDTSASPSLFVRGVEMAISEINEQGGILGRNISALYYDDQGSLTRGQKIADRLAHNPEIIAVIGHRYSHIAVSASVTYQENGVIFISHGATETDLIRDSGIYTFRNIPSDEVIARETAEFAWRNRYRRMAVINDRVSSAKRLGEYFYESAARLGIEITTMKSYSEWEHDFRLMISDLIKEGKFDAVFLAGRIPAGAALIKQMREMGITAPIIGTNYLDSPQLFNIAGKAAEGTIVSTVFDPRLPRSHTRNFVKRFRAKTGQIPDTWAAQGYDAVRLLAYAIRRGGSVTPAGISVTLRSLENWEGVTGSCAFQRDGNITGKEIFFKEARQGGFEFLERELREEINLFEELEEITLRLPVEGIISTIDPAYTTDMTSVEIAEQLFLGLTDLDPESYRPVPELARKWQVSKNGLTYTFSLREDVKWTDGTPVTAHDVIRAVRRNIRPETRCPNARHLFILKNGRDISQGKIKDVSLLGARATDDFTVEFELEYPAAYFPAVAGLWTYRPVPGIAEMGGDWTRPEMIQTNGSYKMAAWEPGLVMILRKNADYFDAINVSIPEVRYYIVPESSVGLAMYKNDQLDIIGGLYLRLPLAELPDILNDPVLSSEFYPQELMFCTYSFAFNTRIPPTDNPLVRKAISAAIDRKLLIEIVTKGNQEPARTFSRAPLGPAGPESGIGMHFDPIQARKWLAQAGYPNGQGFPEISLEYNESETHQKIARAFQTFLRYYLNIRVRLMPKEWSEYMRSLTGTPSGHLIRLGWCPDYPDADSWLNELFHPFKSYNITGWKNPKFGELMDLGQQEPDPEKRKAYYKQAEEMLCQKECVVIPLYFETAQYLVKPRVKGWYSMAIGGQHIRNWYFIQ